MGSTGLSARDPGSIASGFAEGGPGTVIVVVLLLAVIVGALVTLFLMISRRRREAAPAVIAPPPPREVSRPIAAIAAPTARPRRRLPSAPPAAAGGLAIASSASGPSGMVCPTCRAEFQGLAYCTRDARRLVPAEEMLTGGRGPGGVCLVCRRGFEPGLRRCPHDGGDIAPAGLYWAMRGRRGRDPTPMSGVPAKVCPVCRQRHDLAARFCGHDGAELHVVN